MESVRNGNVQLQFDPSPEVGFWNPSSSPPFSCASGFATQCDRVERRSCGQASGRWSVRPAGCAEDSLKEGGHRTIPADRCKSAFTFAGQLGAPSTLTIHRRLKRSEDGPFRNVSTAFWNRRCSTHPDGGVSDGSASAQIDDPYLFTNQVANLSGTPRRVYRLPRKRDVVGLIVP